MTVLWLFFLVSFSLGGVCNGVWMLYTPGVCVSGIPCAPDQPNGQWCLLDSQSEWPQLFFRLFLFTAFFYLEQQLCGNSSSILTAAPAWRWSGTFCPNSFRVNTGLLRKRCFVKTCGFCSCPSRAKISSQVIRFSSWLPEGNWKEPGVALRVSNSTVTLLCWLIHGFSRTCTPHFIAVIMLCCSPPGLRLLEFSFPRYPAQWQGQIWSPE